MFTKIEIALISKSLDLLLQLPRQEISEQFYLKLFQLDPNSETLFEHINLITQGHKLFDVLAMLARYIHTPEGLQIYLYSLGLRHVHYGVSKQNWDSFETALLMTFEELLMNQFTPEMRAAWQRLYAWIRDHASRASDAVELNLRTSSLMSF